MQQIYKLLHPTVNEITLNNRLCEVINLNFNLKHLQLIQRKEQIELHRKLDNLKTTQLR